MVVVVPVFQFWFKSRLTAPVLSIPAGVCKQKSIKKNTPLIPPVSRAMSGLEGGCATAAVARGGVATSLPSIKHLAPEPA
jgi:hypothetical protein